MSMIENNIKIDENVLKEIKKLAIRKNTTQTILINDYLKKAVEEEETLTPECEELYKKLDKIDGEMGAGNCVELRC